MTQTDAFDGIYDTPDEGFENRGIRQLIRNGIVRAEVRSNALSCPALKKLGMDGEFGKFPARPRGDYE